MSLGLRRVFVFFFALLQCMAPLLHAHASASDHFGVHLPEWTGKAQGQGDPILVDGSHSHAQVAVCVASSLEARHQALPAHPPLQPAWACVQDPAGPLAWVPSAPLALAPPLTGHFIPHPCAPPRA
jgi:hypothetical protein